MSDRLALLDSAMAAFFLVLLLFELSTKVINLGMRTCGSTSSVRQFDIISDALPAVSSSESSNEVTLVRPLSRELIFGRIFGTFSEMAARHRAQSLLVSASGLDKPAKNRARANEAKLSAWAFFGLKIGSGLAMALYDN